MKKRTESNRPPPRRWGDGPFRFGQGGRESGGSAGGNGRRVGGLQRMTGGNVARGLAGSRARIGEQFNGWLNTMPGMAGLCWVYCVRTASVWCRVDGQSGCCLRRADGRQRVGRSGSAKASVGNSAKAIRDPGLFRWSGSAVRCPGGQAVFDGAVFTAKGEG
nr:MAG TPA: hypothetical protein [Caudoviricetes sp.]